MDVIQDSDKDKFPLETVHIAAFDLFMICVGGSSHLGGKIFVGPKKLVYVLAFGRTPPPAPTEGELVRAGSKMTSIVTTEVA